MLASPPPRVATPASDTAHGSRRSTVEGLSDSEAQTALDTYTSAALACENAANLNDAKRALEIYVGDAFAARYPDRVQEYVVELTSYGILDPE